MYLPLIAVLAMPCILMAAVALVASEPDPLDPWPHYGRLARRIARGSP